MNKTILGLIFILVGIVYGSMAIDDVYNHTLGWLVEHEWIKMPPTPGKSDLKTILGRKPTILLYAGILIIIGLFVLWKQ
jgi:hypothetical protein